MSEIFTAPWYPWYADDILLSERVELMNLAEEGAYRRALDRAWKKGSLPADPKDCAKAIGKGCSKKIAEVVLKMFVPMPSDPTRMIQERLEIVREEQRRKYLKLSAKGKDAAEKRWHGAAQGNATGIPQAMPKQYHSDSDTDSLRRESEDAGATFAEQVMDGIKNELGVLSIANESDWFIEIERAEKNKFPADHCIETYRLMRNQDWRDSPIKPLDWSGNLPNLNKLRSKQNGTNRPTSEREKSSSRTINANIMGDALINGDTSTVNSILGLDGENNIKGYLPS